jgi:UDP-glucose 4-epimerase
MKALVTGGAGFIGSYLCEALLERGEEVLAFDNLSTGDARNVAHLLDRPGFRLVQGDIRSPSALEPCVRPADQVYHLAAAVGVKTIHNDPLTALLTNLQGTEVVLELSARFGVQKFLLASTSEVYGKSERLPFSEGSDVLLGPTTVLRWNYAYAKAADEFLTLAYQSRGLPTVIVRYFNVVGPRQTGRYGMVVPRFVEQALAGQPLTVYGDGTQTRCFLHVADAVAATLALAGHPQAVGEVFNVGHPEEVTILALAQRVLALTGSASKIVFLPPQVVYGPEFQDIPHRVPDVTKLRERIGFQPRHDLDSILRSVIASLRQRACGGSAGQRRRRRTSGIGTGRNTV